MNTWHWKRKPLYLLHRLISDFRIYRHIILLPATNGIRVFGPLCWFLKLIFRRQVHYVVIGGWLADLLESRNFLRHCIASFDGVYVETQSLREKLMAMDLPKTEYLPNFRRIAEELQEENTASDISLRYQRPIRVCIYSRVVEEKGICDAVKIIRMANEIKGEGFFFLDIYGKIAEEYAGEFHQLLKENQDIVQYCGVKGGPQVLRDYFALLFPSYYEGEGLAGTILDALAAQTPVLANDWKYIGEFIRDGENGFIYPFRDIDSAAGKLCALYENPDLYRKILQGCRESIQQYSTEKILGEFAVRAFGEEKGDD